jgi:ABC-type polysaccharide/polyol phosphate transport system ATPase subunit
MLAAKSVSVRLRKWNSPDDRWHWALQDINLQFHKGDRVGVVGRNGSGKTTLCRVLAGILSPAKGSVVREGRVVPLLGFGAALQPELSGKQNARLLARLLGASSEEVPRILEDVDRQTELGNWLNEPVVHYSTGMRARLAFVVATSISADVLLVDEALGAGDITFRKRAMKRLTTFMEEAKVLIMVSHQLHELRKQCNRVIWLEDGMVRQEGEAECILEQYQEHMNQNRVKQ